MSETKVQGTYVQGTIKVESGVHMAHVSYSASNGEIAVNSKDIRTFAFELLNVADKVDEMNEQK